MIAAELESMVVLYELPEAEADACEDENELEAAAVLDSVLEPDPAENTDDDAAWLDSKLDCAAVWLAEYTLLDAARELDCAENSWADEALAD